MKKGFVFNDNPSLIPANYDMVYFVGVNGKERDPMFLDHWKNASPLKRGVIHRPAVSLDANEYDNASSFKWLLDDLGFSHWNNGNPIIIDIFGVTGDKQLNLDHIRVYGDYVTENFKPIKKPLLRLNPATWTAFLKTNKTEALRLLKNYDILVVQWNVERPSELAEIGVVQWWEYKNGMIAHDETGSWTNSPVPPIAPPTPPTPPTEPEEPPVEEPIEEPVDPTLPEEPIEEPPVVEEPEIPPFVDYKPLKFKIILFGMEVGRIEEDLD